jgi:5-methylcytosine-specific restriction enzyme subunit McrC
VCEFDELSYDVSHNQIVRSTLAKLCRCPQIDDELRSGLGEQYRRLHEVSICELSNRVFRRVQLHRNNSFYEFLLRVCELLHENLLPSGQSGQWFFRSFVEDEHQMRGLFEDFVRNFYRREAHGVIVKREDIRWNLTAIGMAENAGCRRCRRM